MGKGKEIAGYPQNRPFTDEDEENQMTSAKSSRSRQHPCSSSQRPKVDLDNYAGTSTRFNKEAACIGISVAHNLEDRRRFALDDAEDRALEVQANLSDNDPSVVMTMGYSNVVKGFWLHFPAKFCQKYMPRRDASILLEAENQMEYTTRYKVTQKGLSAQWVTFVKEHGLIVGDVLVFHLVRPRKFKVYILRKQRLSEADGALALMRLNAQARQMAGPGRQRELKMVDKGVRKRRAKRVDFPLFY